MFEKMMFEKMFEKKFAKKVQKYYKLLEGGEGRPRGGWRIVIQCLRPSTKLMAGPQAKMPVNNAPNSQKKVPMQ
jgi:hypothetical protein